MIWFVGAGCYHPDMLTIGAKKLNKILYLIFDYPYKHYTFKYFEV